ncbi:MAG: hypothetical protein JWQ84_230 [Mucilaginibacter sp.]|nr:hypothetical protein [Mucilaginibacter sp.]
MKIIVTLNVATYYLMTDQPTTCPVCGTRTEIISDFYHTLLQLQINECLNGNCKHVFFEVEDQL